MSGPEMVLRLNQWFSSGQIQGSTANFGIGAKISALTRNKVGLVYQSWQQGKGAMIVLRYDPEAKVYGLVRFQSNGGEFWTPVPEACKPSLIGEHGTKVTFYGTAEDQNTTECPPNVSNPARWIARALNTRFFSVPEGIEIRAKEGWNHAESDGRRHFYRSIQGQRAWLERNAQSKGTVALGDATAHWWIMDSTGSHGAGDIAAGGHVATLFQHELYEMSTGRAGISKLQAMGCIFGADRVVIYIEPHESHGVQPVANASRTQIKINGEPLNWTAWASAFRERMPKALLDLQHEVGARSGQRDYREAIASRLRQMPDLNLSPRLSSQGSILLEPPESSDDEDTLVPTDHWSIEGNGGVLAPHRRKKHRFNIDKYLRHLADGGKRPVRAKPGELRTPRVHWVSIADATRAAGDLEERAARFLADQDTLLINRDFCAISSMVMRWQETYQHLPGSEVAVREVVQEWFEQQLVEVILGARHLQTSGKWSSPELESLWSETALTTAVLPRWHVETSIGRMLSHRFGSSNKDA